MVLAWSRHMVVRVVFDQKVETWLQHVEAFAELHGVVETVVPDNLKVAAVVRAAFAVDDQSELNRSYRERATTASRSPRRRLRRAQEGQGRGGRQVRQGHFSSGGKSPTWSKCAAIWPKCVMRGALVAVALGTRKLVNDYLELLRLSRSRMRQLNILVDLWM
jgi:hypothetical protein